MRQMGLRNFSTSLRAGITFVKCPPPEIDTGCTFCEPVLPHNKPINFDKSLRNTAAAVWKTLLVLTGENAASWPSKLELVPGSAVGEFQPFRRSICSPFHPVLFANTSLPGTACSSTSFSGILLPDNQIFSNIPKSRLKEFAMAHLTPRSEIEEKAKEQERLSLEFPSQTNENELILICGHSQRDIRCGAIAPLLQDEFNAVLSSKGLLFDEDTNPRGIKVGMISHIGGHAYAGNVVYFKKNMEYPVVYGRVFPKHVQGIVKETVVNGNIIEELYRG
ncbi:unnamed protein product [Kuraishia capsulata CBS 1993]|uniref:Altered inheritance of mitochondria protein 32 n=1 Tax=Kuraishia capsulata CBS 1993 TaxID=1382522 RepID=W6MGH7_9ASCO|nr:uncharacterized protein KUCA_T00001181001 [Kuraishia capsulata CBS 1993]CDK25214.1 unnamed protein product [Kuraishia capsulata CBS 1993]